MTGWIIFGSIVLFLVWLFTRSATVVLDYENKLDIKVKFLFIKLYPTRPKKNKKPPKPKKAKKARAVKKEEVSAGELESGEVEAEAETAEEAQEKALAGKKAKAKPKKKKGKLSLDFEQIVEYIKSASPPVKRLLRKIKFSGLYLNCIVGSDDAAKTAIKYGSICAAIYPLLEFMKQFFTVKIKRINIEADFSREKDDIKARCVIKLRVSTALGCALWLVFRLLKTYLKFNKGNAPKQKPKPVKA